MMGCDPEFFFTKRGRVIGSEKVIDIKKGLAVTGKASRYMGGSRSKFICDGIQVELNPVPETCRALLGAELGECFKTLKKKLDTLNEIKTSFATTIKVSKREMASLSEKSKILGCTPSYTTSKEPLDAIPNGRDYPIRSGGGHIHLGDHEGNLTKAFADPERLVHLLDIIVGNTCVLIDRDEGNIERRKVYGRAGEYRLPKYGLEYRTLSNFWLKSYPLTSFVMSLARLAVSIAQYSEKGNDWAAELLATVDIQDIHKAINTNDYKLAYKNFNAVKALLIASSQGTPAYPYQIYQDHPFTPTRTVKFETVAKDGIKKYFKKDPLKHWTEHGKDYMGWENFLYKQVEPKLS